MWREKAGPGRAREAAWHGHARARTSQQPVSAASSSTTTKGQQRKNNPPVGLVSEATDRDAPKHRYAYDPHLDPTLTWAGKAEHTSFEVPTVSLSHVHERIDPKTIVEAVRRRNGDANADSGLALRECRGEPAAPRGHRLLPARARLVQPADRRRLRGKNNQMILFSRVEPLAGTRWLHADAESVPNERGADRVSEPRAGAARSGERVVVSFGPEHAPLEQRQVELAWEEARTLSPRPGILAFAAFQFDPEAAKDIDELTREKTGMTFLKVQMNPDLLTEDLKKKRASNESFWLMGQPDVEVRTIGKGEHKGKLQVEVHGFDYYNTKTGQIESGDTRRIAMWMLDPDYDGRSLFPRQVFFPMADEGGGWARLARNLKAEIDVEPHRGLSRNGLAAIRGGRPQARGRQDRGRPRHREPQDHSRVMSRARIRYLGSGSPSSVGSATSAGWPCSGPCSARTSGPRATSTCSSSSSRSRNTRTSPWRRSRMTFRAC